MTGPSSAVRLAGAAISVLVAGLWWPVCPALASNELSVQAEDYVSQITGVGDIRFDFDYSSFSHLGYSGSIPAAPRSEDGATRGIFITANHQDDAPTQSLATIFPKDVFVGAGTPTPDYVFRFDAWSNTGTVEPLVGTANYQIAGVNYEPGPVQIGAFNADTPAEQGAQLGIVTDHTPAEDFLGSYGGTIYGDRWRPNTPYEVWGDGAGNLTNQSGLIQMDILLANGQTGSDFSGSAMHPYYADHFPQTDPVIPAGVPANRWATHELSVVNGLFSYAVDGRVFVRIDLSTRPGADAGTLMLGFWDSFGGSVASSPPGANFVIYDNIEWDVLDTAPKVNIGPYIPQVPDLDGDGFVGIVDLNIVLSHWNQSVPLADPLWGDPSGDGFVGIADLTVVLGSWNAVLLPTDTDVPEPGVALMCLSLGVAAVIRRHRGVCRHPPRD